ncbi:MAG: RES family NAD+ phosphorylase [Candidatus Rokubacteria bacterium]|nr:RES family NAD+ phosphorylase [Candidatus Rokubacteria bacterium]
MASLWRIARRPFALDRSGAGARESGGRWNAVGTSVLYAGGSLAIAELETFVHTAGTVPADLVVVRVTLPDRASSEAPRLAELPRDWNVIPPAPGSIVFGTRWAAERRSLVLYVPSVIVPEERNAVLNPAHPAFAGVTLEIARPFAYDPRMFLLRRGTSSR